MKKVNSYEGGFLVLGPKDINDISNARNLLNNIYDEVTSSPGAIFDSFDSSPTKEELAVMP